MNDYQKTQAILQALAQKDERTVAMIWEWAKARRHDIRLAETGRMLLRLVDDELVSPAARKPGRFNITSLGREWLRRNG